MYGLADKFSSRSYSAYKKSGMYQSLIFTEFFNAVTTVFVMAVYENMWNKRLQKIKRILCVIIIFFIFSWSFSSIMRDEIKKQYMWEIIWEYLAVLA